MTTDGPSEEPPDENNEGGNGGTGSPNSPTQNANVTGINLTDEQRRALTLEHNIAITAGAGTGKTTTLTERYMRILDQTDAGPEEIVTVTFTNDAANELRERIRSAVDDRLSNADADAYAEWREIKDNLANGYIHTIHGFCSRLLREYAVEAPVTPEFEVYDNTDAMALSHDIVREVVGDRLATGDTNVSRLARLWDRETLEDVLTGLLAERPQSEVWATRWRGATPDDYLDFLWTRIHPIGPDFADAIFEQTEVRESFATFRELQSTGILSEIDPDDDHGAAKIQLVTKLLDDHEPLAADASTRDRQQFLDEVCDLLTTNDGTRHGHNWWYWGSNTRWSDADLDAEQDDLERAIETLFATINPETLDFGVERDRTAAHYVLALAHLFDDVLEEYTAAKDRQNVLDYDDLVGTAITFLEDAPAIRAQLRDQFAHVMVDEVQDTDPRQWDLVQLLTSPELDTFDSDNVCLVGDEKQSIYRFRGADVTSFAKARTDLATANPNDVTTNRQLSGNFRTTDETLAFCNGVFADVFRPLDGNSFEPFEAEFQNLTPERPEGRAVQGHCEYLLVPDDNVPSLHAPDYFPSAPRFSEPGDREAHAVAARLTQLFADPPTVYDSDGGEYRDAKPGDVSLLFRSRTRLKAYERALDACDIPYTTVSGTGFYESPEVTTVMNLLRVLEDPANERALYGLLRSPLFGIPDDDLARLLLQSDADGLWAALGAVETSWDSAMAPKDTEALVDSRTCIERWRHLAGMHPAVSADSTTPWGTLLSQVIDETGYLASIAGDERPRQAAVNIEQLREQFRLWEEAGVKTPTGLLRRIETRREVEKHADEGTIPEETEKVQLRTVHSAKGLEFNIVVLPELATEFNFQADIDEDGKVYFEEFSLGDDAERIPILGIKSPTSDNPFTTDDTLVRRVTRNRMKTHERAELKRLLYVAMTRARDHLVLSGIHEVDKNPDGTVALAKSADASEANCWRDWLQPVLLEQDGGDKGESLLERLAKSESVDASLSGSHYKVSHPAPPIDDWRGEENEDSHSFAVDVPSVEKEQPPTVVTGTDYADLVAEGETNHYGPEGDTDATLRDSEAEKPDGYDRVRGLQANTLGVIVHRLCECRPPRDRWEAYAQDVATRMGESLTDADRERVFTYVERAIDYVDDYEAVRTATSRHDEFSVVARLGDVRIHGEIDHLVITPDAFHIIDYKTNNLQHQDLDELVEYYLPQLRTYAVALHQSDPDRTVHSVLYFTDGPEARTEEFEPAELADLNDHIAAKIAKEYQ